MSSGAVGTYGAIGVVAAMANALKAMGAVVFNWFQKSRNANPE